MHRNLGQKKWAIVLKKKKTRCFYCKKRFMNDKDKTFDHVVPLSAGGNNNISNVVISCDKCNQSKAANDQPEFLEITCKRRFIVPFGSTIQDLIPEETYKKLMRML